MVTPAATGEAWQDDLEDPDSYDPEAYEPETTGGDFGVFDDIPPISNGSNGQDSDDTRITSLNELTASTPIMLALGVIIALWVIA